MSEDLLKSMLESLSRVPAAGGGGAAVSAGASESSESLPHIFCKQLESLLKTLQTVFPENEKLSTWLLTFQTIVLGNKSMEEWVVKKWHYDMTHDGSGNRLEVDHYTHTKERNIEALLSSDLWVFKEISARDLYFHPDLDDEDRESLCKHFDMINSYAKIFSALPDGMREAIERVTASIDPTQEITHDTMTHMFQNLLTGPETNMEQLMSWASQLVTTFSDGQGLDAIQTLMTSPMVKQATGGIDITKLMGSLQSELSGGVDGHTSFTPDADTMMKCMSMLGLGGSK